MIDPPQAVLDAVKRNEGLYTGPKLRAVIGRPEVEGEPQCWFRYRFYKPAERGGQDWMEMTFDSQGNTVQG